MVFLFFKRIFWIDLKQNFFLKKNLFQQFMISAFCVLSGANRFFLKVFWFRLTFVDCFSGLFSWGFYNENTNISELIRKNNNLLLFLTNFYTHLGRVTHTHSDHIYFSVVIELGFYFFYFNLQKLYFVFFLELFDSSSNTLLSQLLLNSN